MALKPSPHYKFIEAAKAALDDEDSEVGLTWKIQKIAAHRSAKWNPGAYLCPLRGFEPPGYENANDKITVRTLAVLVKPGEMKLADGMHEEMQKIERVEDIFRNATMKNSPASVRALNSISPDPAWRYQITRIEPADRFIASAFGVGFDASATVLASEFIVHRTSFDFTALGS